MSEHIRLQKLHTICIINEFRENKLSNRSYFKHPESSPQLYPAQRNPSPHQRCQAATRPPPSPGAASGSSHSSRPPPPTVVSAPTKQTAPHLASEPTPTAAVVQHAGNDTWHPSPTGSESDTLVASRPWAVPAKEATASHTLPHSRRRRLRADGESEEAAPAARARRRMRGRGRSRTAGAGVGSRGEVRPVMERRSIRRTRAA